MLVPEVKQALVWLNQVTGKLDDGRLKEGTPLTPEKSAMIRDAGGFLDDAREDHEQTLEALDAVGSGKSGFANPIMDLGLQLRMKSGKGSPKKGKGVSSSLQSVKRIIDEAIHALEEYVKPGEIEGLSESKLVGPSPKLPMAASPAKKKSATKKKAT